MRTSETRLTGQVKVLSHTLHRYLLPCPRADGEHDAAERRASRR